MIDEEMDGIPSDRLQVVRLEPGDVLVLHCEHRLSLAERDRLASALVAHFPGHSVLIVEDGLRLEVVRPDVVAKAVGEA